MNLREILNKIEIKVVYDIGANMGKWSNIMKDLIPNAEFYLFEAHPYYINNLKDTGFKYFIDLLSDEVGKEIDFYDSTTSGESYYKENSVWNINYIPTKKISNTIDNIAFVNNIENPDFIKLDTQGSELDILNGCKNIINNTKIILCEMPIMEYNVGAPNIYEYLNNFDKLGFYPMNIEKSHFMDNLLVQIDIIFMRKDLKNELLGINKMLLI